jgi:hypothetical protein
MSTIKVDAISDEAGTGAPNFPNGLTGDGSALTGINTEPHKPAVPTGTTPSLDLGTYNYFRQTLTGDTTLTFASVPTDARWSYTFTPSVESAYDLTAATTFILNSYSVAGTENQVHGLFFKPDGTKFWTIGRQVDHINEFSVAVPWDISTATPNSSLSISAQESNPSGLFFSPDGLYMYHTGESQDKVHQYTLSTAWTLSTASFTRSLSVYSQEPIPLGIFFRADGLKMYIAGSQIDEVNEYTLTTAWDISTASFLQLFSVNPQETQPSDIFFKSDGLTMFLVGSAGDDMNEYTLTTAWDISTASFTRLFNFGTEPNVEAFSFNSDGTSVFIVGSSTNTIREYSTGDLTVLTLPASVQNPPITHVSSTNTVTYEFSTLDGGTNVYLINEEVL